MNSMTRNRSFFVRHPVLERVDDVGMPEANGAIVPSGGPLPLLRSVFQETGRSWPCRGLEGDGFAGQRVLGPPDLDMLPCPTRPMSSNRRRMSSFWTLGLPLKRFLRNWSMRRVSAEGSWLGSRRNEGR